MCLGLALATALLAPAIPAAADTPPPTGTVTIGDSGISPRTITVAAGGSIAWTNSGSRVHTATSLPGTVLTFDTGGLGHGQANVVTFGTPGTFNYSSSTDCLKGNSTPGFDCGPYSVVVVAPPAGSTGAAPQTSTNVAVSIDDTNGFQPTDLSIQAGQTVVWTNNGTKVHTVTQDGGYFLPGFDSGGIAPGQSFSYTFTTPSLVRYHSSTEPVYYQDPNSGQQNVTYAFRGSVTITGTAVQPVPAPTPAPAPAGSFQFTAKDVTAPPVDCGSGNRVPCFEQAPNMGSQYVQGHVLDQTGQGIGGINVWFTSSAGGMQTVTTDPDGLFTALLFPQARFADNHCPVYPPFGARTYSVWLTDSTGAQVSNTRTFQYYDCSQAGEYHFDFVKTG